MAEPVTPRGQDVKLPPPPLPPPLEEYYDPELEGCNLYDFYMHQDAEALLRLRAGEDAWVCWNPVEDEYPLGLAPALAPAPAPFMMPIFKEEEEDEQPIEPPSIPQTVSSAEIRRDEEQAQQEEDEEEDAEEEEEEEEYYEELRHPRIRMKQAAAGKRRGAKFHREL
jgi:hypothetical protein